MHSKNYQIYNSRHAPVCVSFRPRIIPQSLSKIWQDLYGLCCVPVGREKILFKSSSALLSCWMLFYSSGKMKCFEEELHADVMSFQTHSGWKSLKKLSEKISHVLRPKSVPDGNFERKRPKCNLEWDLFSNAFQTLCNTHGSSWW